MIRLLRLALASCVIAPSLLAHPQQLTPLTSVTPGRVTYDMGSGQFIVEPASGPIARGTGSTERIYNNNTPPQYYGPNQGAYRNYTSGPPGIKDASLIGPPTQRFIDEGRIPSISGGGTQDVYRVRQFQFIYYTSAVDVSEGGPGSNFVISFWSSGGACVPSTALGSPTASFVFQGAPGLQSDNEYCRYELVGGVDREYCVSIWVVTVQLDAANEFDLVGDCNAIAGDADGDLFSWSFEWLSDEEGGIITSGDPLNDPEGQGTFGDWEYYGTGLGTQDLYWREKPLTSFTPGCYFFGGYPNWPFASYYLTVDADVADTVPPSIFCPSGINVLAPKVGPPGKSVSFMVTAMDNLDPAPSIVCVPPSGSFFPVGTTQVVCTATDASVNQSTCSFPVVVAAPAQREKP